MSEDRVWYRNKESGDRGYLVERADGPMIHLDRADGLGPEEVNLRPFSEGIWIPDATSKRLTKHQVARIAFEADRELCRLIGKPQQAKKEFISLKDKDRIHWTEIGPMDNGIRDNLFDAIFTALSPHMEP